jgi:hypothetical protein
MNLFSYSFCRDRRLVGLRWFVIPLLVNALAQTIPCFDGGATNAAIDFFSIPYWVAAAVVGLRRARRITIYDFVFLVVGDFLVVSFLWHLHPQTRSFPLL